MKLPHGSLALALIIVVSPGSCARSASAAQEAGEPRGSVQEEFMNTGETKGERVEVPSSFVDRHPAFLANRVVSVEGTTGDLFAGGETVEITGTVGGNAFVGCRTARITGVVHDDLFFFGETVTIEGDVRGDVYGFFQEVRVLSSGSVGGDIHAAGERLSIDGQVGGRIAGGARKISIRGRVAGDVLVACEELELHENARVEGSLRYDSPREPMIREGAVVVGEIERTVYDPAEHGTHGEHGARAPHAGSFLGTLVWKLILFLSTLIAGALLLAMAGPGASRPSSLLAERPALGLGLGFVELVVAPIVGVFCCFLPPLAGVFFLTFALALFLARIVTALCVGGWLLARLGSGTPSAYLSLLVGLVLFYVVTAIPFLGPLAWLGWVVAGLGGLLLWLKAMRTGAAVPAS